MNPGPHGPELCELSSRNVGNDRFQFGLSANEAGCIVIQGYSPAGLLHEVLHGTVIRFRALPCIAQPAAANEGIDTSFQPRLGPLTAMALAKDDLDTAQCAKHDVSSCLARHGDDDFAPSMSGFQIADRLRGLTESVGAVYDGCHSAGLNEFAQKDTIFLLQRS